jgi:hypothetical protein
MKSARNTAKLSDSLERKVNMYALAAGTAGVGLLVLAESAEAKIVYTRVNESLPRGITKLDLNGDGITDFSFCVASFTGSCQIFPFNNSNSVDVFPAVAANEIWAKSINAYAVVGGAKIGSNLNFSAGKKVMAANTASGNWQNVQHRYLALKFVISGAVHYGWARFNVEGFPSRVTLTGYAYETIANKSILAGNIIGLEKREPSPKISANQGDIASPVPVKRTPPIPAGLGLLAGGSEGLPAWRTSAE